MQSFEDVPPKPKDLDRFGLYKPVTSSTERVTKIHILFVAQSNLGQLREKKIADKRMKICPLRNEKISVSKINQSKRNETSQDFNLQENLGFSRTIASLDELSVRYNIILYLEI